MLLLGKKDNPYPYFNISDCLVLTSEYEGYPVVFQEAFVLRLPIITTEVSDSKLLIENKWGYITTKEVKDIYEHMRKIIEEGYILKEKFDAEKYNKEVIEKLEEIFK